MYQLKPEFLHPEKRRKLNEEKQLERENEEKLEDLVRKEWTSN